MIQTIKQKAAELLQNSNAVIIPEDCYTNMKYPKLLPIMRFRVDRYMVSGFGRVHYHDMTKA